MKKIGEPTLSPLSVYLDAGVVPRASRGDNHNQLGEDLGKYLVVDPGDIVFNKLRTWQGGLGTSAHRGIVSPAYYVCQPGLGYESRFLHYLLRSDPYLAELTRISKYMPPSQFDTPWELLRLLPILSPPLEEQRRIADFLDAEVSRIDRLVSDQLRLVSLLDERIDSRVMESIGSSALTNVKDPVVSVLPIRRVMRKLRRPPIQDVDVITAYRDGQVTARSLRRAEGYTLTSSMEASGQYVEEGDIVIHGLDGFAGAIGTAETNGNCSPVYHACEPIGERDSLYVGRLLRVLAVTGYLGLFATSTRERAVDFRNWDQFGRIPIPDPGLDEQRVVGSWIKQVPSIRTEVDRFKALANERRRALITAAVTGQFDVSTASGRNTTQGV
ncbi:hypothetical protein [Nocardia asteroides]